MHVLRVFIERHMYTTSVTPRTAHRIPLFLSAIRAENPIDGQPLTLVTGLHGDMAAVPQHRRPSCSSCGMYMCEYVYYAGYGRAAASGLGP